MSELLCRAAIPTNSLYLIDQEAGVIISPLVQYIRATSSASSPSVKEKPHKYMTIYTKASRQVEFKFNLEKAGTYSI